MPLSARQRLVFPLDVASLDEEGQGRALAERLAPAIGVLKIGLELFVREGPRAVELGRSLGLDVFLDLKLHDIPETIDRAVASASSLGARYLTVHASGGRAMIARAVDRAARAPSPLTILAVTVLTSLDASDLASIGVGDASAEAHAVKLAKLAVDAGARGFVCSAVEVAAMRRALGPDVLLVTPGIRAAGAESGDQKRVATPRAAIARGADLLVVGRPIRDAADPVAAANGVVVEIAAGLTERGEPSA